MNSTTTQNPIQLAGVNQKASLEEELSSASRDGSQGYRLNDCQDGGWVIFDMGDNIAFSGSLAECEAWMDRAENLKGETGFLGLIRHMLGLYRESASSGQSVE